MWSSIVGNEHVVAALARSLELGRASHAYLFVGPEGVGKRFVALKMAQALNCTGLPKPCGACLQCRRIMDGKHPDVQSIGVLIGGEGPGRKVISIDQIRDAQQSASLQPFQGAFKVFIIDGAEHLSAEAANCLLKTLEEPPPTVCFILLASDERAILPTVLSRCRVHSFRPIPRDKIAHTLLSAHGVEPVKAQLLASLAEGRVGWAVRAAKDGALLEARAEKVSQVLQLPSLPNHERLALSARLAEDFTRARDELFEWLWLAQQCWRDMLLTKAGRQEAVVNVDRLETLASLASILSPSEIADAVRQAQATMEQLERNANPRLALDVLTLHLPTPAGATSPPTPSPGRGRG